MIPMKRTTAYWAAAGAVGPAAFLAIHVYATRSVAESVDSLAPCLWPSSFLLLGFQDPAYPVTSGEIVMVLLAMTINVCAYAAVGGLLSKAWAWWKEQNRLHGAP